MQVTVYINSKEIPGEAIGNWELQRAIHVTRFLQSKLNLPVTDIIRNESGLRDISSIRSDLTKIKTNAGIDKLRSILKTRLAISALVIKTIVLLSLDKRKSSVTEIVVDGCTAEDMLARYFRLMLKNSPENLELCLAANPDHYILIGSAENVQEVVETTGGSPLPTQFFIRYGDDTGLTSKVDSSYPCQAAGVASLKDGTPIGGVRHQMRNEASGFRAKLEVEFPSMLPKYMIKQHQMHLACEFYNWFTALMNEPNR